MTYKWVASSGNSKLLIPVRMPCTSLPDCSNIPQPLWSRETSTQKISLMETTNIGSHQWQWYKRNHDSNIHQKTKKQLWVDIVKSKRFKSYASQTDTKTNYNTNNLQLFLNIPSAYNCNKN